MSNLFGSQPKIIPEFTGLQVNTSVQVLPIPLIYGSPRVSVNLIYFNGFNTQLVSESSGKGILGGGKGGKEVEYFATLIMAIGEGPLGSPEVIYQDQSVWTPATYPTNGAFYFDGSSTQAPWSYVVSNWPSDARGYKDTAYYGFSNAQLDASATVPQINLVLQGFLQGSSPLNNSTITINTGQYDPNGNPISYIGNIELGDADADPGLVLLDFLTNVTYGATFPAQFIDDNTLQTSADGFNSMIGDAALSTYCQAVGFGWSVVFNNVESANSIVDRLCKNLVVAPVWNGALLRFVPYWDSSASGNPGWDSANGIALKYFTPQTTPIVTITLDQILQSDSQDEDPIFVIRKDPQTVYNTIRLDFKDRTNFFNDNTAESKDEVHIELYGPRVDNIGLAQEFSLMTYAQISATAQLRRNIAIMNNYSFKLGPMWGWLEPMFVVNIPDPTNYSNNITVRVVSIEDDEDENSTVICEAFPLGAQAPTAVPGSPTTPPNQGPTNIPPSPVYPPVIFCPTTAMLTATGFATPQVVVGASGGDTSAYMGILDPQWGGCNVWVSLDNVSYELLGTLLGPSLIGSLSAALNGYSGVNPDNVNTLSVNLGECDGALASVTSTAAAAGHTVCVVQDLSGFELVCYTTATMTGDSTFALTGLYRGFYGTTSRAFGAGSQFLYVGSTANILEENLPPAYLGATFFVKLQSFNTLNGLVQDLSDCVAYIFTVYGPTPPAPIPPPMVMPTNRRLSRGEVPRLIKPRRKKVL